MSFAAVAPITPPSVDWLAIAPDGALNRREPAAEQRVVDARRARSLIVGDGAGDGEARTLGGANSSGHSRPVETQHSDWIPKLRKDACPRSGHTAQVKSAAEASLVRRHFELQRLGSAGQLKRVTAAAPVGACTALARSRQPSSADLHRLGRDQRIREQLRGADRAQGRRHHRRAQPDAALVEEPRHDAGRHLDAGDCGAGRCGRVAAKTTAAGPPSLIPNSAAFSKPTASMTASISVARSSSVRTCGTGSDSPTPALSNTFFASTPTTVKATACAGSITSSRRRTTVSMHGIPARSSAAAKSMSR